MSAKDMLADDIIIRAADITCFIYGPEERNFQWRIFFNCSAAKRVVLHFRGGNHIAARRSTFIAWIAAQGGVADPVTRGKLQWGLPLLWNERRHVLALLSEDSKKVAAHPAPAPIYAPTDPAG